MHTTLPDVIGRECDLQEAYLNDKPLESMEIVNKVIELLENWRYHQELLYKPSLHGYQQFGWTSIYDSLYQITMHAEWQPAAERIYNFTQDIFTLMII